MKSSSAITVCIAEVKKYCLVNKKKTENIIELESQINLINYQKLPY